MEESQTQTAGATASAAAKAAETLRNGASFWKRRPVVVVGSAVVAVLLFFALHFVAESFTRESTDDAFISSDVVSLAPRVAGQVLRVCVRDNQSVQTNDPLVEIDPRDYDVLVRQKKEALAAAETNVKLLQAGIEWLGTQVITAEATARQSEAQATADQANAEKADADQKREIVEPGEQCNRAKTDQTHEHARAEVVVDVDGVAESSLNQQATSAGYVRWGERDRFAEGIECLLEPLADGGFMFRRLLRLCT